jgi:3',5'-cyclic AMP phosphodiesterase CpdA
MLIAQITDMHLGFQPGDPNELNRKRLDSVLAALMEDGRVPDIMLATGDLAEHGAVATYETLKRLFSDLPFPVWPILGNHDLRANFLSVFDDLPVEGDSDVRYVVEAGPLRIVMVDTLEEGRHGGSFGPERAAWLDATLAAGPGRPTLVCLHHPPIESGNAWMSEDSDAAWVEGLRDVIARHPQVIRLLSGHLHRGMLTSFGGATLSVCPATAPQVALDFRDLDVRDPDGRDMIVAEQPGFALHYWNGRDLVTQFGAGGEHPVLARFNARMVPEVQKIVAERAAD